MRKGEIKMDKLTKNYFDLLKFDSMTIQMFLLIYNNVGSISIFPKFVHRE